MLLSSAAREKFPFSIECKNTERLNLWDSWSQAKANAGAHSPILVVHKNNSDTLCVLSWKVFLEMAQRPPIDRDASGEKRPSTSEASSPGPGSPGPGSSMRPENGANDEPTEGAASPPERPGAATATIRLGDASGPHELAVVLREIAARLEGGA